MCHWNRKCYAKLRFGGLLGSWVRWTVVVFSWFDHSLVVELFGAWALTAGLERSQNCLWRTSFRALRSLVVSLSGTILLLHVLILHLWFKCFGKIILIYMYRQISNISRSLIGYKIVDHSVEVGASPVGAAPTTSSFSTQHLASLDLAKTAARRQEKHLRFRVIQYLAMIPLQIYVQMPWQLSYHMIYKSSSTLD